jgi:hypothetical protein
MYKRSIAAFLTSTFLVTSAGAAFAASASVQIDSDDIGGVVMGPKGPEAGVWVIAETTDLPTKFSRVVATDDRGRYVIPDLPKANYEVWVRGYGLVDSAKITAAPGKLLDHKAVVAPDAKAAAQYYPANYWYAMLEIPPKSDFPGTGPNGNGIAPTILTQEQWIDRVKTSGCQTCHQLGNKATREIPDSLKHVNSMEAWAKRIEAGQAGGNMVNGITNLGRQRALQMYANWTDRIADGEVPFAQPERPSGIERGIVVTTWDYSDSSKYMHDAISTDKRNPTVNANGPIFGAPELSSDKLAGLDPVTHTAFEVDVPLRDPNSPIVAPQKVTGPSPYFGEGLIWDSKTNPHSSMYDEKGRLWTAAIIRPRDNPRFCMSPDHPSAKLFPLKTSGRQVNVYDPKTKKFTLVDTCFGTHHVMFADDANDTLWFSGGGEVAGWFSTKVFDETGDEQKAQGWTAFILDSNGNGKRDEGYTELGAPVDPAKDRRVRAGFYSVIENPVDKSIWGSFSAFPGLLVRLDLGANPPATALTEIFEPPLNNPNAPVQGYTTRGIDADRNGVIWTNLTGSSHLASFDRRKCKGPLNGPTATGQHCPEGWKLYTLPGPNFKGLDQSGSAVASYLMWVDQFNTFGMGENVPMIIGNGADAIYALDKNEKLVTLRVPYPMSFYAKGMDGRIDDPKTGWKGRGLWASSGTRAPWHVEGGLGEKPKLHKFQLRPDPLAH